MRNISVVIVSLILFGCSTQVDRSAHSQKQKEFLTDKYSYYESVDAKFGLFINNDIIKSFNISSGSFEFHFPNGTLSGKPKTVFSGKLEINLKYGNKVIFPEDVTKIKSNAINGIVLIE